ncbi:MAG: hypothetical protein ACREBS_05945 [Nitrososphaerales archaeon]
MVVVEITCKVNVLVNVYLEISVETMVEVTLTLIVWVKICVAVLFTVLVELNSSVVNAVRGAFVVGAGLLGNVPFEASAKVPSPAISKTRPINAMMTFREIFARYFTRN